MKILHVETGRHFYGGPQQVIYLMSALAERGIDGTLVCPPNSGIDSAARGAGFPVRNLFCAGDLDLPFAYRLAQYLKDSRPDIVHCHSRRGADVMGGIAASITDIPAVVSRRVESTEIRVMAAVRYRPFRKIIAVSGAVARVLREHGVNNERLVVIRDAVDTDRFAEPADREAFRREFAVPPGACVIGAAGQLIPRKGQRYLLEAVAQLRHRQPRIRLIIFGEGHFGDELRALASSLGLGGIAQFAGFRDDLDDFFGCFDIFAHPALAEGLGVVTLKAAAAGVPVVAFASGGLSEAVAHDETGLLVAPEDVDGLRKALAALVDDGERRRRMGAAGQARMRAEFSIAKMAEQHIALYDAVLSA